MLLCVDIGNTNIVFGIHHRGQWVAHWRMRTVPDKMADEYAVLLKEFLRDRDIQLTDIRRVILSSVVPPLTGVFRELCQRYVSRPPLVLGPGVRTGLNIRTDNPAEVGADLIANAVAAYDRFRRNCIVVDFGTATTFSTVAEPGEFLGVAIAPGLSLAADALAGRTAQLPRVQLTAPPAAIGKNTVHSMQSGLIFGYVGLTEGLIRRLRGELGGRASVIATGGLAQVIAPLTSEIEVVEPWLTLDGLRLIAERNPS
ncbi:MAG: type III pantothenate kinase [Anaerolineae bacterium]|nr:type III pantothenate kinase [Anaerolineae bacterium]